MFERSHLSIGGVLGHGTVTTTPRYLDKHYPPITIYEHFFQKKKNIIPQLQYMNTFFKKCSNWITQVRST